MRSTDGKYYQNLDHIRAVAAFLVLSWHLVERSIPSPGVPSVFVFSVVSQGHCGVSLFMVLSAYLFTKLLSNKSILLSAFYFNRFIRLFPLLIVVMAIHGALVAWHGRSIVTYLRELPYGFVLATWPGGAWSITTELHFYVILPVLLWLLGKWPLSLIAIVFAAVIFRFIWWQYEGSVQALAYYTIAGRIDQFLLGMLAAHYGSMLKGRHLVAASVFMLFSGFYSWFDILGGYSHMPDYPSSSALWIVIPTIEGAAFGALISYYDQTFRFECSRLSRAVALAGTVSYSIYLLHGFELGPFIRLSKLALGDFTNVDTALLLSPIAFILLVPFAWLSYACIEAPFLRLRKHYVRRRMLHER